MIQVFAGDRLAYDSRLEDYKLLGLPVTEGLNKSGTAQLIMPPGHPLYSSFVSYKTLVTIYENDGLVFRGRALYPADDFYRCRTITCEGERGFFRDGVIRPYLYQDTPAAIFAHALSLYNAQVDEFKRFALGEITVTDANNYIRMESTTAEKFDVFFNKLVERCGGYITFHTNETGERCANWLDEIGTQSTQPIEFGENLLNYEQSGASPDLATVIVPYGAQLEDGTRVDITSVTENGEDYLQDDEAVALRGTIVATVTWDDVTEPANLKTKAAQWLAEHKLALNSLKLTALDLSKMDRSIGSFHTGDRVRVVSKPHGVDEWFQLTDRVRNMLDDASGEITLGKTSASLVGADVATATANSIAMERQKQEIYAVVKNDAAAAELDIEKKMTTLLQQTSESIMTEVAGTYATADQVTGLAKTTFEQLEDSFSFEFTELQTQVENIDGQQRTKFQEMQRYIRFVDGHIELGEVGSAIILRQQNDRISFIDGGAEVAYISNKQLYITDAHFLHSLRIGNFEFIPRENGNLSLVKVVS